MHYRLKVEIEYLIALGNEKSINEFSPFSNNQQSQLRKVYKNFNTSSAEKVKEIETATNHDVKAIEYYIQSKVKKAPVRESLFHYLWQLDTPFQL